MTTEEFIDTLQQRALLPAEAIGSLRQFVRKSLKIVTPESLAKMLVEKGRITAIEAEQLLGQSSARGTPREDDLSLAPIDDPRHKHSTSDRNRGAAAGSSATKPAGKATTAPQPAPPDAIKPAGAARIRPLTDATASAHAFLDDLLADGESRSESQSSSVAVAGRRGSKAPHRIWMAASVSGVLLFATATALIAILHTNGDTEWLLAEKVFAAGMDRDAINRLDAFLDAFPNHPRSGTALVYRETARLRQTVAAKTNWEQALAVARDILPRIVELPDFAKVRDAIGKILSQLAAGLARQAKEGAKGPLDQRRRQAQAALDGLTLAKDPRYTPDSQKPWRLLRNTEDDVAGLVRAVDRDTELERAAAEIRSSIAAGQIAAAFARRDQLRTGFPELRSDATFDSLEEELVEGEAKFIKVDREQRKAETQPRATPIISTIVYAARNDKLASGSSVAALPAGGADGAAVAIFIEGTAYWLSRADGTLLGRRFLGYDSSLPLSIDSSKGADFIVVDAVHQEIARVSASAAKLRWRQPIGGAIAGPPLISDGSVFAATHSGRLVALDAASGGILRSAEFTERFRSPPAVSADGTKIALMSHRGDVFILAAKDLHTSAAEKLADQAISTAVAPVWFADSLAVIQSEGWENSVLRIVTLGGAAGEIKSSQPIPLPGQVNAPPIVEAGRLILATDRGALAALATGGAANGPLSKIAELPPADGPPQPRFIAAEGSRIWLGGSGIADYEFAADGGAPRLVWQRFAGDSIIQSPALGGNLLIVARTRRDVPGVWVTALDPQTGESKWETALGARLMNPPLVEANGKTLRVNHPLIGEIDRATVPSDPQVLHTASLIASDSAPPSLPKGIAPPEVPQSAKSWLPGARALWGPIHEGNTLLEATDRELLCSDAKGELRWKKSLPDGPPIGDPLVRGSELILASATGTVWRVGRQTGVEKGKLDVGQPLASGPTLFDKRLVVVAADGSLLFIESP